MGSARVRHEARLDQPFDVTAEEGDPADRVTLDDTIRMALAVVLERLTPPEPTSAGLSNRWPAGRTSAAGRWPSSAPARTRRSSPSRSTASPASWLSATAGSSP